MNCSFVHVAPLDFCSLFSRNFFRPVSHYVIIKSLLHGRGQESRKILMLKIDFLLLKPMVTWYRSRDAKIKSD